MEPIAAPDPGTAQTSVLFPVVVPVQVPALAQTLTPAPAPVLVRVPGPITGGPGPNPAQRQQLDGRHVILTQCNPKVGRRCNPKAAALRTLPSRIDNLEPGLVQGTTSD